MDSSVLDLVRRSDKLLEESRIVQHEAWKMHQRLVQVLADSDLMLRQADQLARADRPKLMWNPRSRR